MSTIIRFGGSTFTLSLRTNVVSNPLSTPFDQVLSWLCQKLEYKTAATVSLSLLNDEKIKDSIEHEGLLDGITPLLNGDNAKTLTSLADMTVGCLIKGGVSMANTLEGFLARNTLYDSARASLMLVGTIASVLSIPLEENHSYDENVNIVDRLSNAVSPSVTVLWPLNCLMKMAVARNCLSSVLLLLNLTIPNELRWRRPQARGFATSPRPSLGLFLAFVELVLESTSEATRALLDLFDEESGLTYWLSVEDDTRLALCLFSIHGKHVFLLQAEVRLWVLKQLTRAIESPTYIIHDEWLCDIVSGVFCNAECEIRLGLDATRKRKSSTKPSPCLEVSECYREEMKAIQDLLIPQKESGGLDFDILIPSLLLLSSRDKIWREGSTVSTQILLNALCDLAGRKSSCTPRFLFDGPTVMRQCALTENIQAAAFLVSGRSGLILECADLIIAKRGITMKDAEVALFGGTVIELKEMMASWKNNEGNTTDIPSTEWTPTSGHCHVLWLLLHHTLNVVTYGDFDAPADRGKLNPIIAGRIW